MVVVAGMFGSDFGGDGYGNRVIFAFDAPHFSVFLFLKRHYPAAAC
jgi:hypothetical protein